MEIETYIAGEVERARVREGARLRRRAELRVRARGIADAIIARYPSARVHLYGSASAASDPVRFRRESDLDVAVEGLSPSEYWAAWAIAERLAGDARLDFVRVEDVPAWLTDEIRSSGEPLR